VGSSWQRNVFALAIASFVGFTGFTLVMPFLPIYFQELGVTDVGELALWSGLSLGVTPAMTALLAPFWGRLSDRFGRKIMVERSLVSFIVLMGGMSYVTEAWHVFALRAVQGLFAGYGGLTIAMAAESAPREHTAYAIGVVQTAQRLGPALGPVIGGAVAQLVGLRNTFLVTSGFYAVALALVFTTYDERLVHHLDRAARDRTITFRNVLAFRNFVLLLVVVFALQFVDRSFGPVLPLYVSRLGTPVQHVPLVAGLLFSIAAGTGALGNQICGVLLRRYSPRVVIAGSAATGAVGALVYLVAPGSSWLFLATPLFGLAMGAATTSTYTAASSVMPSSARGAGFGLLTTASLTGLALSPIIAGLLGSFSIRAVFLLDVCALAVMALGVLRMMGVPPEDTETESVEDTEQTDISNEATELTKSTEGPMLAPACRPAGGGVSDPKPRKQQKLTLLACVVSDRSPRLVRGAHPASAPLSSPFPSLPSLLRSRIRSLRAAPLSRQAQDASREA
jgi:DHA1 family multidrug resistance protein-like MFS transporter